MNQAMHPRPIAGKEITAEKKFGVRRLAAAFLSRGLPRRTFRVMHTAG